MRLIWRRLVKTSTPGIYLFLSSEKGFVAFCCTLTNMQKHAETIDTIGDTVFSMVW
jgi:hypothetical protein